MISIKIKSIVLLRALLFCYNLEKNINGNNRQEEGFIMYNNDNETVASVLALALIFFFVSFLIATSNSEEKQKEVGANDPNKSELVAKQESNSTATKEEQQTDFLKKYKDKYSSLVPYKVNSTDHLFYYNSEGKLILLSEGSSFDTDKNEKDFINLLENNQSEFDKETKNILDQFKSGDSASRISLLSSNTGKAHLLYQYQNKNLSEKLSGLFFDITIYYNPGSEEDKLSEALGLVVDFAQKSGKVYRLNIVDINKVDPLELEEIRYSGDIIAISHPVQISEGSITNHPELRSRVDLSDDPENILKLTEYYN